MIWACKMIQQLKVLAAISDNQNFPGHTWNKEDADFSKQSSDLHICTVIDGCPYHSHIHTLRSLEREWSVLAHIFEYLVPFVWNYFQRIKRCGLLEGALSWRDFEISKANINPSMHFCLMVASQDVKFQLLIQITPACLLAAMLPAMMTMDFHPLRLLAPNKLPSVWCIGHGFI